MSFDEIKKVADQLNITVKTDKSRLSDEDAHRLEFVATALSDKPKKEKEPETKKAHTGFIKLVKKSSGGEDKKEKTASTSKSGEEKETSSAKKETSEEKDSSASADISKIKIVKKSVKEDKSEKEKESEKAAEPEVKEAPKASEAQEKPSEETAEKAAEEKKAAPKKVKKEEASDKATAKAEKSEKAEDAEETKKSEKPKEKPAKKSGDTTPDRIFKFKKVFDAKEAEKEEKTQKQEHRGDRRHDRSSDRGKTAGRGRKDRDGEDKNRRTGSAPSGKGREGAPARDGAATSGDSQSAAKGKSKKFFDNKDKEKENRRFEKRNDGHGGKSGSKYFDERSLEKQTRSKKKYKTKPTEPEVEIEELLPEGTIAVNVPITVGGLSEQAEISITKIIMALMNLGIMATINQTLDKDTVEMLADDLGIKVAVIEEEEEAEEVGLDIHEDSEKDLKPRAPIITVMGHVDHGKTSLLDSIRKTNIIASESGGITQHIGASEVEINGKKIVFLDTPGHEAFTTMRARGAQVTDIAVLVVAADDSVKPQTIESISHAKAANVPIIVAINKMDKPGANPDKVKKDLADNGVLVEDWGGNVISVPVSAKKGEGITELLEMILLQAEMMELRANPDRLAMGTVIEARLDKAKGPIATLLVTNGTLRAGQSVVAGTCSGKVRRMTNYRGDTIAKALPATPVEILGLSDVPMAGDSFNVVKDDKLAREIAENRKSKLREDVLAKNASTTLDKLFSEIQEGERKQLDLIVKGDVQGSVGAIVSSLEKLENDQVKINIIHSGVGTVTESDVKLAETANAIIIGFNVRPTTAVVKQADDADVEIRLYRVIYDIIEDVEKAMKGMLDPEFREEVLGKAEIRETFKVPNVGIIGGAYVTEGKVERNKEIRLVRDGIVIHEGTISSLRRFKDDVKEVAQNYECGIGIENYNDIKPGDVIECFTMVEIEKK